MREYDEIVEEKSANRDIFIKSLRNAEKDAIEFAAEKLKKVMRESIGGKRMRIFPKEWC